MPVISCSHEGLLELLVVTESDSSIVYMFCWNEDQKTSEHSEVNENGAANSDQ